MPNGVVKKLTGLLLPSGAYCAGWGAALGPALSPGGAFAGCGAALTPALSRRERESFWKGDKSWDRLTLAGGAELIGWRGGRRYRSDRGRRKSITRGRRPRCSFAPARP